MICTALDQCHVQGTCNPANGLCSNPNQANGTGCNDGNACSFGDVCTNGVCGGTPYACTPTVCQASSTCNGNGGCNVTNLGAGSACTNDGNPCTSDVCDGSGNCTHPAVANGTSCGAGSVCQGGTCQMNTCFIGGVFYASGQLNPANQCQSCNPGASTTSFTNEPSGFGCSDGNACTLNDTCNGAGSCISGSQLVCTAEDACHNAGTCAGGACSNPVKSDGESATCGGAGVVSIGLGGSSNVSGFIVTVGQTDYFEVVFTNPGLGQLYHPEITLTNSQGGAYTMNVYSSACAGGLCTPATQWEQNYDDYNTANPNGSTCEANGNCTDPTPRVTVAVVAITRTSGTSCVDYTVNVAQPDNP